MLLQVSHDIIDLFNNN